MHRLLTLAFAVCLLPLAATAAGWPQFLGPARNATSPETGLARSWPDAGPKVLWRAALGLGYGGAAVEKGEVFLLDRPDNQQDVLRCFSLADGQELWSFAYEAEGTLAHDGSRTTPTVTGDAIFIVGPMGHVHCIDRKTHTPHWKAHLLSDYEATLQRWGTGHSPLLHGDLVILAPQGRKAGLVALDKTTGKQVWASQPDPTMTLKTAGSYVTPTLAIIDGVEQILFVSAPVRDRKKGTITTPGLVTGISAKDGSRLWSFDTWQSGIPITSPLSLGDDRIFLTGAYGAGSTMLKVTKTTAAFEVKELFHTEECGSQIQQPIVYKDHIYVNSYGKERKEGLLCLAMDGTVRWHTANSEFISKAEPGLPHFNVGNMILADGMLYILDGKAGDLALIDPNPEGYKELARMKAVLGGEEIWAPMALSDGKLVIRDQSQVKCLDVRGR